MTTSEEQIARAIEALVRIAEDIKNEWRADREIQARGSNRGFLDLNTMKPLKTESGRLVGYAFPNETITMGETPTKQSHVPKGPWIDLTEAKPREANSPTWTTFRGVLRGYDTPIEIYGTFRDVV
jgi:hypothetical protein